MKRLCTKLLSTSVFKVNNFRYFSDCAGCAAPAQFPDTPIDDALLSSDGPCSLKPEEIVALLDKHIIGQRDAKRAVAVALRNRWRRHHTPADLRNEIHPKNMLMIGPTGVGKTEIARRVAKLTNAPFVKVECTKFTEVGYIGRDVDSIIDDLYRAAVNFEKQKVRKQNLEKVKKAAKDLVLEALCKGPKSQVKDFEEPFDKGELDTATVEIEVPDKPRGGPQKFGTGTMGFTVDIGKLSGMAGGGGPRLVRKKMTVKEAVKILEELEMEKLLDDDEVARRAVLACEQDGIVVIDEIDKVVVSADSRRGYTASDEGVQQDLLPLIEGTVVNTKLGGPINTDHILFIASGAFSSVKPSDMLAELQGRLPIRVELQGLTKEDFYRILTEPKTNLIAQHKELLSTENVRLVVTDEAILAIADASWRANSTVQNIGARRLHSVVERVMEDLSFNAPEMAGQEIIITAEKVWECVGDILKAQDLKKFLI